jgi:hypothetical protein
MACQATYCCTREDIKENIINGISGWLKDPSNTTLNGTIYIPDINSVNRVTDDQGQITTTYTPTNQNSIIYDTAPTNINPILDEKINFIIDCLGEVSAEGDCGYASGGGGGGGPLKGWEKFTGGSGTDYVTLIAFTDDGTESSIPPHLNFDAMSCPTGNSSPPFISLNDALYLDSAFTQTLTVDTQFIGIDEFNAEQVLDTHIYELMPEQVSNVDRILAFFTEYSNLKGEPANPYPPFVDVDADGITDDFDSEAAASAYQTGHDISTDKPEGYIPRLEADGGDTGFNELSSTNTLEWLRDDLNEFLKDIDYEGESQDTRPIYQDKSTGYLKIRNMNQAIIVRNEEGNDIGLETWEADGFTITMWVKFLDKVNGGTLFNYGNPYRDIGAQGFSLETFIGENEKRYVKLTAMVAGSLIDSHVGMSGSPKLTDLSSVDDIQYTEIPIDFNEWYFIVATYDKYKDDALVTDMLQNEYYWMGNCTVNTGDCTPLSYTSDYGNKCKVEIISKSDLLLARGFKQE